MSSCTLSVSLSRRASSPSLSLSVVLPEKEGRELRRGVEVEMWSSEKEGSSSRLRLRGRGRGRSDVDLNERGESIPTARAEGEMV